MTDHRLEESLSANKEKKMTKKYIEKVHVHQQENGKLELSVTSVRMYVVQAESLYTTLGETNIYNYFGKLFSIIYYICICITYNLLILLHEGDHYRSIHNFIYFMGKQKISQCPSAVEYITKMCYIYKFYKHHIKKMF